MPIARADLVRSATVLVCVAPTGVPHAMFQYVDSSRNRVVAGRLKYPRRSALKACRAGSGITLVWFATVARRPIGPSTCLRSSTDQGDPPTFARMRPSTMKFVWE